ncbi:MAG: isocitrate/isopropylmalate family dehydrogenase [Pseudomonadota bacterium]
MKPVSIAVVPGDGIGPEVCRCALRVVEAATKGIMLDVKSHEGGAESYLSTGEAFPAATQNACLAADAVLHGAVGRSEVLYSDGTEVGQDFSMQVRALLDLFANVRPSRSHGALAPTLARNPAIDYVIVRENTEGFYASRGGGNILRGEVSTDTVIITRAGVERVTRKAAEIALARAERRGREPSITIVDKANVLRSYAFFRRVARETLEEFPAIDVDCVMVDAMATYLVQSPERFDVIVTENLCGDILSDLGAATVGGLGLAPSAELGDQYGYFQGIHGSAPDLAGKGVANPVATILSAGMMLEWLGERQTRIDLSEAGARIGQAVSAALATHDARTRDLGGDASSEGATDAIIHHLARVGA